MLINQYYCHDPEWKKHKVTKKWCQKCCNWVTEWFSGNKTRRFSRTLDTILSHFHPVHILIHYFSKIHFNINLQTSFKSSIQTFPCSFPIKSLWLFLVSLILADQTVIRDNYSVCVNICHNLFFQTLSPKATVWHILNIFTR